MTLKKVLAVVALVGVFMVGSAFADGEFEPLRDNFNQRGYHQNSQARSEMMELTGLSQEEFEEYRRNHCLEDGESMIDRLKEDGLYEQWESEILANFQERLDFQVDNNRLSQAEADEALAAIQAKIEEGPPFHFGNSLNNKKGFGSRGRGRNCIR